MQTTSGITGARLYLDVDLEFPDVLPVAGGEAVVFSARAPGKDSPNEDAAAVIPVGEAAAVLVVADGMGGARAGDEASKIAVQAIAAAAAAVTEPEGLRAAILDAIERASEEIQALGLGAGTTLAAVELSEGRVRPYHVGDSMILVVGQRGKVKLQTVSHSPVGFAVEAGLIDEAEAMHHEDRHIVSNYIGEPNMRTEVGSYLKLAPRDTLVIASDGLFDNLHVEETAECVRKGPLKKAAERLARDARKRMTEPRPDQPSKPDDLTFILYRLKAARRAGKREGAQSGSVPPS